MPPVERPDNTHAAPLRRQRRGSFLVIVLTTAIVALAAGFFYYAAGIQAANEAFDRKADGIVALTGGPDRIADAVELLATGHGKRLLITGVNPTTRMEELARLMPRFEKMFSCCIDLDRSALNTIGNAVETRRWAHERNFRSLIVVTSRFHMPRALAELNHQLPEVELIPYPVVPDRQRIEPWWTNFATARVLAFEYIKYLAAIVRMRFDWIIADRVSGTARGTA